ncbi:unnamed protein product [Miscanthus lutarioriparius]|uniref:Uncharacterized protein n=1 Tax=Miscanthus lutarioriparius TaxID=422564 RepID=A0A811NRI8_9POAL|nr:unnamed protein product [Miscanthus lutarioriparius]
MRAGRRRRKRSAPARFLPSRSQIAARPLPLVLSSCDGAPEGSSTRRSPCSPRPRLEACPGRPPLPRLEPAALPGSCRRSPHPADSLIPKRRSAAPRMSTTEGALGEGENSESANLLKWNSDDVGWEYGVLVDPNNKDKVKCKLLQAMEAKQKCKKALDEAKRKREEKTIRELELREEVSVSRVGESDEVTCVGSSEPHKLGPIDKWTRAIDPKATKSDSLKQQQLNKELWKERTNEVHKYIARWAYTCQVMSWTDAYMLTRHDTPP